MPRRKHRSLVKKRAGSPYYWYDFTVAGERYRGSTEAADKAVAEEIAARYRSQMLRRDRLGEAPPVPPITLDEAAARAWIEHWKHLSQPQRTAVQIRHLLRMLGRGTHLHDITSEDVATYVRRRRAEYSARSGRTVRDATGGRRKEGQRLVSATTVNRELESLAALMERAKAWGVRLPDPPVNVRAHRIKTRPPETKGYLRKSECQALLDALVPHARPIVLLDLMTGLRQSNLMRLRWRDVHLDVPQPYIEVIQKGGRPHVVPLPPPAVAILSSLAPSGQDHQGRVWRFGQTGCTCVWCRRDDTRGTQIESIRRTWETARKAIGRDDLTFHQIRHSLANWLLQSGESLETVRRQLGHTDIKTTSGHYAHLERSYQHDVMSRVSAPFGTISAHDDEAEGEDAG